ncbi:hypothetical protein FNH13_17590 [Ornithinimicrobium ciconiae]|uniref:Uncharacterized protein n=1 Tax=Ornithinimicrobium ciconiae TaxID=2594265 RepID=A0A516GEF9_9MICO|nr:hypothetical protein [Ornithinimicrobium ciconiae]QDO89914.1 hypothetical protein FNH13_17590 [Ornithinimicrobium ciconiae]
MRRICAAHPAWAAITIGGTIADIMQSLPDDDPWRNCSARIGKMTTGSRPPVRDGARLPAGGRLGTWSSFVDTLGRPSEEDITLDPAYIPIATNLTPVAEAVLAFGAVGWEEASAAVAATTERGEITSAVDDLANLPGTATLVHAPVYTYGVPALRWASYRRRSYGTSPDDPWLAEALYRWSWRAGRILGGMSWDENMVSVRIEAERLDPIPDEHF